MSSRFERVSCVEIEPNELHAYAKNRGTLNKLTLGILEKFARVSFVFLRVENFTTQQIHFYSAHQQHLNMIMRDQWPHNNLIRQSKVKMHNFLITATIACINDQT